jgi:hypothetical protein
MGDERNEKEKGIFIYVRIESSHGRELTPLMTLVSK